MAINVVYGIYDEASECFVQFLPSLNDKIARLSIEKMFKDRRLQIPLIYDYPNLFRVFKLGTFDDNKGIFENTKQELLVDFCSLNSSCDTPAVSKA